MPNVSCRKWHYQQYQIIKTPEFVSHVDENLWKIQFMRPQSDVRFMRTFVRGCTWWGEYSTCPREHNFFRENITDQKTNDSLTNWNIKRCRECSSSFSTRKTLPRLRKWITKNRWWSKIAKEFLTDACRKFITSLKILGRGGGSWKAMTISCLYIIFLTVPK